MRYKHCKLVSAGLQAILCMLCVAGANLSGEETLFRESFKSLDDWNELTFPDIDRHTRYEAVTEQGRTMLLAQTENAASGLVHDTVFDVFQYPRLRWSWKVNRVFTAGDARRKSGDDYPIRVYVMFQFDPESAGLGERIRYGLAKKIHGRYPPHSTLNYIWANRDLGKKHLPSPYTSRSRLIPLEHGEEHAGEWRLEEVNILEDYRAVFGETPPAKAALAIMSDSDNTGETASARMDFIEVLSD